MSSTSSRRANGVDGPAPPATEGRRRLAGDRAAAQIPSVAHNHTTLLGAVGSLAPSGRKRGLRSAFKSTSDEILEFAPTGREDVGRGMTSHPPVPVPQKSITPQ